MKRTRRAHFSLFAASFALVFSILLSRYALSGYAPFGSFSLATRDADIQYLDFYMYLKDVMAGRNDIAYTFSKMLGGSMAAVYSYYLSSPFSLLLPLFADDALHAYFDLAVALKLATAAVTFCVFLLGRFKGCEREGKRVVIVLLSAGYALGQYSIAQSSNLQWLDGVYMLPLMLLFTYRVARGEKGLPLSVCTALAILFNWYSAGIDCVFSALWMAFESALCCAEEGFSAGRLARALARYALAMALGVMMSAVLLLPTAGALQSSSRGQLDIASLLDFSFTGNPFSSIQRYSLMAISEMDAVSFYCGSFALLGCVALFADGSLGAKRKAVFACMGVVTLLCFYVRAPITLFSLLKNATSFYCRFSYVGIATISFFAAFHCLSGRRPRGFRYVLIAAAWSALLMTFHRIRPGNVTKQTVFTVIMLMLVGSAMTAACLLRGGNARVRRTALAALCGLVALELGYSTRVLMNKYHTEDVDAYRAYVVPAKRQIDALPPSGGEFYRITQTATRNMSDGHLTANYNEAMAYRYRSIASYTSSPDDIQRDFLGRLGYRKNGENMCIVNTSILAADALLSVRYVLSDHEINGLERLDLASENGKSAYVNPYCLPAAFLAGSGEPDGELNPFEYQNALYSLLLGRETALYTPLPYAVTQEEEKGRVYEIDVPEGNVSVYGNLPWKEGCDATLDVNGVYRTDYACWLSPSVFDIPTSGAGKATVRLSALYPLTLQDGEEQFYALHLDALAQAVQTLRARAAAEIRIENGRIALCADAHAGQTLILSVAADDGWSVRRNGEKIEPELFAGCLYAIPMAEGENEIVMTYRVKFLREGALLSLLGALLAAATHLRGRRGPRPRRIKANLDKSPENA